MIPTLEASAPHLRRHTLKCGVLGASLRTAGQPQLARAVFHLLLDLMHRVVTSEQIVADRYRVMESTRDRKEQENEHKRCDYLLMVLLDGRGYGGHDDLPQSQGPNRVCEDNPGSKRLMILPLIKRTDQ